MTTAPRCSTCSGAMEWLSSVLSSDQVSQPRRCNGNSAAASTQSMMRPGAGSRGRAGGLDAGQYSLP